jgi:virulence-associated protein VapD
MKKHIVLLALLVIGAFVAPNTMAQDEELRESKSVSISTTAEGKVQLKVKMKKGNDETTFEKTYDSHEEMYNDPDLSKYGIDLGFNMQGFAQRKTPKFYFHNGPGGHFWDDDFEARIEDLRKQMEEMTRGFGSSAFFFGDEGFMDIDSLMQQYEFKEKNGKFFFNGEEIMDMDSLQDALKDKFDQFQFDFDWGDDARFRDWSDDEDDIKVIRRTKVYIRSAREEDKSVAGTAEMQPLPLGDISFYPNPSDGQFDLALTTLSDDPVQLVIVDDQGNEVFNKLSTPQEGVLEQRIDLSANGKGICVLKCVQNGKALTKRIIIE